jgi:hypothetical protein
LQSDTQGGSRMPELGPLGSVRGALSDECPYRNQATSASEASSVSIQLRPRLTTRAATLAESCRSKAILSSAKSSPLSVKSRSAACLTRRNDMSSLVVGLTMSRCLIRYQVHLGSQAGAGTFTRNVRVLTAYDVGGADVRFALAVRPILVDHFDEVRFFSDLPQMTMLKRKNICDVCETSTLMRSSEEDNLSYL